MSDVAYPAALLLAVVFAWAGASKLRDPRRTVASFAAAGLPAPQLLGTAVPGSELLLALGLAALPGLASYAALAMLAAFTTFLVLAIRSGSVAGCGCFGSTSTEPANGVALLRNGLLAAAAMVAGFADGPEVPGPVPVAIVALAAALAGSILVVAGRGARTVTPTGAGRSGPDTAA